MALWVYLLLTMDVAIVCIYRLKELMLSKTTVRVSRHLISQVKYLCLKIVNLENIYQNSV